MPLRKAAWLMVMGLVLGSGQAVVAGHDGVPRLDPDYGKPVDAWWSTHPFNPHSANYDPNIRSPEPRIDVAEVHKANPNSLTAGIEEALAMLPVAGGTLFFPKAHGVYEITHPHQAIRNRYHSNARIQIVRRSNIHFLSDGARLKGTALLRIASMEFADKKTEDNPVRNFYFQNLTLDCDGDASFINCDGVRDVVFDNCTFTNLGPKTANYAPAVVYGIAKSDNWWLRNCTFNMAKGQWGFHPDGQRGSGVIGCKFVGNCPAAIMVFTNDDVDRRWGGYLIFANNTFEGTYSDAAIAMGAAQTLIAGNSVTGPTKYFVRSDGKQSAFKHEYKYSGNQIIGNTLENVKTILRVQGALEMGTPYKIGQYTVRGNRITGMEKPVFEEIRAPGHTVDGPNVVEDNGPEVEPGKYWKK